MLLLPVGLKIGAVVPVVALPVMTVPVFVEPVRRVQVVVDHENIEPEIHSTKFW